MARRPFAVHGRESAARLPLALLLFGCTVGALAGFARAEEEVAAIEKRIADAAQYLSSDELEGRAPGTKGIDLAADYIARQFAESGLETELFAGTPMQEFCLTASAEIGSNSELTLIGPPLDDGKTPEKVVLEFGKDFSPTVASGSGPFDLPLAFVGYGISGEKEGYDDYAGLDVQGKAVVVLRHEPRQDDPSSAFNGTRDSAHASLARKLSNARGHGAAAVVFCTDQFEIDKNVRRRYRRWQRALDRLAAEHEKAKKVEHPTLRQIEVQRRRMEELIGQIEELGKRLAAEYDPVQPFRSVGAAPARDIPVVHCRRKALDPVLQSALEIGLAELEEEIDEGPTPHSRELAGWRAVGQVEIARKQTDAKNVVAVLEGEGPLAEETIVVGAHYDHLGRKKSFFSLFGPFLRGDNKEQIYNGADDNASGVAVMIEVARALAGREERLRRRVVFVAFTAEERGLLGSAHYVNNPPAALESTVAMLNLDMVGRLRDQKLTVQGTGTAQEFDGLLEEIQTRHDLTLDKRPSGHGPSDHASFWRKGIPVLFFFTGVHKDLHRPTDDFEKLNVAGMRQVSGFVTDVIVALANADKRPQPTGTEASAPQTQPQHGALRFEVTLDFPR